MLAYILWAYRKAASAPPRGCAWEPEIDPFDVSSESCQWCLRANAETSCGIWYARAVVVVRLEGGSAEISGGEIWDPKRPQQSQSLLPGQRAYITRPQQQTYSFLEPLLENTHPNRHPNVLRSIPSSPNGLHSALKPTSNHYHLTYAATSDLTRRRSRTLI